MTSDQNVNVIARVEVNAPGRKTIRTYLTERELEVLAYLAADLTNKAIGNKLHVSPLTVKNHIMSILRVYNVRTRVGAIVVGIYRGDIQLNKTLTFYTGARLEPSSTES